MQLGLTTSVLSYPLQRPADPVQANLFLVEPVSLTAWVGCRMGALVKNIWRDYVEAFTTKEEDHRLPSVPE
jgi:hypothetical protein